MSEAPDDSMAAGKRPARGRRWPWRGIAAAVVALAALAAGGYALLTSQAGVDWLARELVARSGGALEVEGATGTVLDSVEVRRLAWHGPTATVVATDVALTWRPSALLSRAIVVQALGARELVVEFEPSDSAMPLPVSLALPVEVAIDRVAVGTLEWRMGTSRGRVEGLAFGYTGGAAAHRVSDLSLATAAGMLTGRASIGAGAPFAIDGRLTLAGDAALNDARIEIAATGSLSALAVDADGRAGDGRFVAHAALAPLAAVPLTELAVDARDVDLARWDRKLPATRIAAAARARPVDGGLDGTLDATNALAGTLDADRTPVERLVARFAWRADSIALDDLAAEIIGGGRVAGRARIPLGANRSAGVWTLDVRDLDLSRLHAQLAATRLAGRVDADFGATRRTLRGHLADRTAVGGIEVDLAVALNERAVEIERLRVRVKGGELAARGRVALDGERAFTVDATAAKFDPSRFGAYPAGSIDGTISASGVLSPDWRVRADLALASTSRLAGLALSGTARGSAGSASLRDAAIDLRVGSATLVAAGSLGNAGDRFTATLDAPRLAELVPLAPPAVPRTLAGALRVKAGMTGAPTVAGLEVAATGEQLRIGPSLAFARLAVHVAIAPAPSTDGRADLASRGVRIDVDAADATTPSGAFATAHAGVAGTLAAHTVSVALAGPDLGFDATAHGGLHVPAGLDDASQLAWTGTVDTLAGHGPWALRLAAPASLAIAHRRVRVGEAHVVVAEGNVHLDEFAWDDGRVTTRGRLAAVPVATVARLVGRPLPMVSTLTLGGAWSLAAAPKLNGSISLRREDGDLWLAGSGTTGGASLAAGITTLEAAARFDDDAITATAAFRSARGGSADATLAIGTVANAPPGRIAPDAPLALTLVAELSSLQLLQPWAGTTAAIDGRARLDVAARGTVRDAPLTGTVTGSGLRIDAPRYGLHFSEGRVSARLEQRRVVLDELTFTAGTGVFRANGTLAAAADTAAGASGHLAWHADRFRVFNRPDLRLVVSGDGEVALAKGKLALTGSLKADDGNFVYEFDPAATLGDDVVVKGWPRRDPDAMRAADVPLAIDVDLDFGDTLRFAGRGLDTQLRGRINVRNGPAGFTGTGSIRAVNGTYFAYGQKLVIDPGRLIFNGPLDNPGLDIVALRKNLAVEAGVAVTGTVKVPIVQLTSYPPVPDNEKLSWLVLGRSLDRTSGTDIAALQAASAALLGPNSKPVTTSIAQSIGLDDISFRSAAGTPRGASAGTAGTQGQVVAIGKRLTENLSIAYEQGLTVATNALRIEYNLSPTLSVRAEAGTVSGVGIFYRRSFE